MVSGVRYRVDNRQNYISNIISHEPKYDNLLKDKFLIRSYA